MWLLIAFLNHSLLVICSWWELAQLAFVMDVTTDQRELWLGLLWQTSDWFLVLSSICKQHMLKGKQCRATIWRSTWSGNICVGLSTTNVGCWSLHFGGKAAYRFHINHHSELYLWKIPVRISVKWVVPIGCIEGKTRNTIQWIEITT